MSSVVRALTRVPGRVGSPATLVLLSSGALAALLVGIRARPDVLFDDAAITFRYAARLAEGLGFTFNDGDRTNGASAPLYTLVLAAFAWLGGRPEQTAVVVGVVAYAVTTVNCGVLALRAAGRWAGALAMALVVTSTVLQNQALSGMESSLAAALGTGALVALSTRHTTLAAVLVGLAVVNRMDAVALAVAVGAAAVVAEREVPRRMAVVAAAVVAPWLAFSWLYFGSPVPHSATQKLAGESGAAAFDPSWFLRAVTGREGVVVFVVAVVAPALWWWWRRVSCSSSPRAPASIPWPVLALFAALAWAVMHTAFYSVVDLGAPYPWYTTVVFPVLCTAAAAGLGWVVDLARRGAAPAAAVGVALVVALVVSRAPAAGFTALTIRDGAEPRASRELDRTRRDAGRFVGTTASQGQVVRTCFGWVAYGALHQPIDEVCPLSTREPVDEPTWFVESPDIGEDVAVPSDAELVERFDAPTIDGRSGTTFVFRRDTTG